MSLLALDTDILRSVNIRISRAAIRRIGARLEIGDAGAWKNCALNSKRKSGERLFLIADQRDRASEMSFYLRDKRVEGPGHPPVYIVESQDMENQFSFWPRYDEFVEAPSQRAAAEGEVYTEEKRRSIRLRVAARFTSRARERNALPHNIRAAFRSAERVATIEVRRFGAKMREWKVFLCRNYRTLPL